MKKILCLVLALLLLAVCLAGCSSEQKPADNADKPADTANKKTVETIRNAGQLVIATSPDFPPFEELQADGVVEGIEIDVLRIICERLGVELKIEQMDFDSVLPGVQAGKYDVGVSGITVTENRKKNTLFTDPYCLAAQAIVVTADSDIASKADLTGKTISVQTGTTAEEFCMAEGYTVNSYAANSDAELALVTGKVDAWVIDDLTAAEMVDLYNSENEDQLVILSEAMTTEPYAFAFAFGSEELVEEINKIVNGLVADGTIASIFARYNAPYTAPSVG